VEQTDYFFLNTTIKPFSSQLVREAVTLAIHRNALSRLDGGNLAPGCYFLPPAMIGQPSKPCPYGNAAGPPNVAKAKKLIAQARDTGAAVSVYSEQRQPKTQFATYYASVLSSLGFKVTIKPVADSAYFTTVGNLKLNAQTGFDNWLEDFPNPGDFYQNNLDAHGIQQTNNVNLGQVNDPKIQNTLTKLYAIPASQLTKHVAQWQALDYYTAQKAYALVLGYPVAPVFASNRLDYHAGRPAELRLGLDLDPAEEVGAAGGREPRTQAAVLQAFPAKPSPGLEPGTLPYHERAGAGGCGSLAGFCRCVGLVAVVWVTFAGQVGAAGASTRLPTAAQSR
jgi:ABC-type oligopeptide transport system substrate-binding subunit